MFNDFPTITDKLQVFGDIRVGTTGTNGCLRNFAGTGIAGTCSSDRRFKKDITPFGHVLDQVTALQPVHYSWRAADFPAQHFGDSRAYGLIAQDVEQVLPELVVTDERRVQSGRLQQAAAAHHPGRQGTEGGERRAEAARRRERRAEAARRRARTAGERTARLDRSPMTQR